MYYINGTPAFGTLIYQLILAYVHCLNYNIKFIGAFINKEDNHNDAINHYKYQKKHSCIPLNYSVIEEKIMLCQMFDMPFLTTILPDQKPLPNESQLYTRNSKQFILEKNLEILKSKFKYYKKNNIFTVSIHIRRGDVNCGLKDRFMEDTYYVNLIMLVKGILEKNNIRHAIHIHSEYNLNKKIYEEISGCTLFLNEDVKEGWIDMINADIFIMSNSTYSMVPAIYNNNVVIYNPFFFNPLKNWVISSSPDLRNYIEKEILKMNSRY